ncbi:hypothetical protein DFAR_950006 [Desulfarculales bacterium]
MRQEPRAGEKTFIDYTGQAVDVVVPLMGVVFRINLTKVL